ncbi:hypothetical protein, partial [Pseudomonas viridiflava]|uniref:hypothetical protein n=1 Tax=Pseudomonas viridiflava TaxID=33069 RepID=UPI00197ECD60
MKFSAKASAPTPTFCGSGFSRDAFLSLLKTVILDHAKSRRAPLLRSLSAQANFARLAPNSRSIS